MARRQAAALGNLGLNAISRGALEEAFDFLTRGLALARQAGDEACQARCLNLIGVINKQRGDFVRAREILSQSLGIFRALGDPQRAASLDNNLGAALRDWDAARACFREAAELAVELKLMPVALDALGGMAVLLSENGEEEQAAALAGFVLSQPAAERQTRRLLDGLPQTAPAAAADLPSALVLAFGEDDARQAA